MSEARRTGEMNSIGKPMRKEESTPHRPSARRSVIPLVLGCTICKKGNSIQLNLVRRRLWWNAQRFLIQKARLDSSRNLMHDGVRLERVAEHSKILDGNWWWYLEGFQQEGCGDFWKLKKGQVHFLGGPRMQVKKTQPKLRLGPRGVTLQSYEGWQSGRL